MRRPARPDDGTRTLRLAHRGDHRRWIENSADALLDACQLPGIDGVEFDVRMSSDGEPVVLHDRTLERTFGLPLVAGQTPAIELMRSGVPHLADMLALFPAGAFLDIELKETPSTATFDAIRRWRGPDLHPGIVSSFDAAIIAEVLARQPTWPVWLNAVTLDRWSIATARAVRAAGVAARWPSITGATVSEARAAGLAVAGWTVIRRPTRTRLEHLGVAAIIVEGPALEP